jgi:hypothetical protein
MQGYSNFFGWRPLNLSEIYRDLVKFYDPLKSKNAILEPQFWLIKTEFFFFSKFGDHFWTFGDLFGHYATLRRVVTPSLRTNVVK